MKKTFIALFVAYAAAVLAAQATVQEQGEGVRFSLTETALDDLSVWYQQEDFIRDSRESSFFIPGRGQFMNGETAGGILYLTGSLSVRILAWTAAYLLLPPDLMFGNLNPLTDRFSLIEQKLKAHSFKDFLPSASVLVAGALVNLAIGFFSSRDAERLAREKIASGKKTFKPDREKLLGNLLRLNSR